MTNFLFEFSTCVCSSKNIQYVQEPNVLDLSEIELILYGSYIILNES